MELNKTIRNCKESNHHFFNLCGGWVNMDILKPNILFYVNRRERNFIWIKENIDLNDSWDDIYVLKGEYDWCNPYVVIDFSEIRGDDNGFVMYLVERLKC